MGLRVTTESAAEELPLDTKWGLSEMPLPEMDGLEYGQQTPAADDGFTPEMKAKIKFVHDYVMSELRSGGEAYLKQFTLIFDLEEVEQAESKAVNLCLLQFPLAGNRTIMHLIIRSVSEGNLNPSIATELTKQIVHCYPGLIMERSSLDGHLNALELAVSSENCLGIIKAIYEHGMLVEEEAPNDKGMDLEEEELEIASVQGQKLIPPGYTDPQTNTLASGAVSQGQVLSATDGVSDSRAIIMRDGKVFRVDIEWRDLTQPGKDTFLHMAFQNNRNEYARYLLDKMKDMNQYKHVLEHKGPSGLTPLHEAVNYTHCNTERVELVEKLIRLCPEALALDSAALSQSTVQEEAVKGVQKNYAPYKYFLELEKKPSVSVNQPKTLKARTPASRGTSQMVRLPSSYVKENKSQYAIEDMRRLLRLGCMQYHGGNRETLTNLIGKPGEIHLNLTSREEVRPQFFKYMERLQFEPLLQYVCIPNLRAVDVKPADVKLDGDIVKQDWWKGSSRKDFYYIFRWLKKSRRVERILSIVVDDDPADFHGDEVIEEAIKDFDIEKWNWVKFDMCSDTIYAAAKNVRHLTLHWSGNRAVLKSWAAPDGLAKFEKLKEIRIMTLKTIESPIRYIKLKNEFRTNLKRSWESMGKDSAVPSTEFKLVTALNQATKKLSNKEREEKTLQQKWITSIDEFVQKLMSYLNNRKDQVGNNKEDLSESEEIRLAIIDDGVYPDRDDIGSHIVESETFYDNDDQWPAPYQSTYGHGHLMARLIKRLCPKVKLYVAKLDESWREGRSQITTKSAAKAIRWAKDQRVDIISMSWTIETPEENAKVELQTVVGEALDADILLFCASDDQGNLNNMPYPACIDKRIFWIGPATALGRPTGNAQTGAMFIAPGAEGETLQENSDSRKPRVGSSIATARCAGLAALVLQCILLAPGQYQRIQVRKENCVRKMFNRMSTDKEGIQNKTYKYLRVWNVFDAAKKSVGIDPEFNAIKFVADTFLKDVDPIN